MTQLTNEALMFEGRMNEAVESIKQEIAERESPKSANLLVDLQESYELLPSELKNMIGYNPQTFLDDLKRLLVVYRQHTQKPCWTKLTLAIEAMHSKERSQVMVAAAMFADQRKPEEESWLSKARKKFF
ncbi:hypothetical protein [Vibrio sp. D431a]|uniref:hypothetical protein n=1 Tax=Vibrio sp. D431a TaxID=2837388 RepID=UPI0025532FD6|nr:hypothetical protein [Vibrio sp. D431a]MDK9790193.1 hypothetical protein [Vibrio sp. D431a]